MLGGGYFTAQNKILPGAYINFISKATAETYDLDRGVAAFAMELDWGPEKTVQKIEVADFIENSTLLFGYPYEDEKLKGLRDLFANIKTLYTYRLNSGGVAAKNTYATAKYPGTAGNKIKIAILTDTEESSSYQVQTIYDTQLVDDQTVTAMADLVDNEYVTWIKTATLTATASTPLTGGTNGTVTGEEHQGFLDAMEKYSFHSMGTTSTEESVKKLYDAYQRRMREEVGKKFQTVLYNYAADYEGVVNVKNKTTDTDWPASSAVYYTTGLIAGCAVGASNTNQVYNGEFTIDVNLTQKELETAIQNGEFTYHNVGDEIRVLTDLNSLVNTTKEKGDVFKRNETIRTIDEIATYTANLFNTKYLGKIRNDASGRVSLQTDLSLFHQELQRIGAITNFDPAAIEVLAGKEKTDVVVNETIEILGMMEKLYMTCIVG